VWHYKNEWGLKRCHPVEALPILLKIQGKGMAPELQSQFFHYLGGFIQSFPLLVLSAGEDGQASKWYHILLPRGGRVSLWGLGKIQGALKGVSTPWDTGLVVGSNLLQQFPTTNEDPNGCSCQRCSHGQTYQWGVETFLRIWHLITMIKEMSKANQRMEEGIKSMPSLCLPAKWMPFFKRWIIFNLLPLLVILQVE